MKTSKIAFTLAFALLIGAPAFAQYDLTLTDASGAPGASVDVQVLLDNNGDDIQGWSFGACHDGGALSLTAVADGAATLTVNNGGTPDFNQVNVFADIGFSVGVVISFTGQAVLPAGATGSELNVANYELIGAAGTTSQIDFCGTIGSPPVDVLVVVAGQSFTPNVNSGTIELVSGPPPFSYSAGEYDVDYDGNTGETTLTVSPTILEDPSSPGFPSETQGFSMGMEHDDALMSVNSVSWNADLGFEPDFEGINTSTSNGWTIGVVYSFTGANTLTFENATPVLNIEYSTIGSALAGLEDPTTTGLNWSDTLGSPPVVNVVVVGGASLEPALEDGSVTLFPQYAPPDVPFIRGNCNGDSTINIADAIWILNDLFQNGPSSTCAEACDVNQDDFLDSGDAIFIISYRLLSGPAPSAPFPACGAEEGADCVAVSTCP
ncbi:MAG: dockerin type I domain-containing protein [Planctomycetota bacterium]|nr:dockerin type I domain-containing protein [Planctomycetota bacterium]